MKLPDDWAAQVDVVRDNVSLKVLEAHERSGAELVRTPEHDIVAFLYHDGEKGSVYKVHPADLCRPFDVARDCAERLFATSRLMQAEVAAALAARN